MEEDRPSFEIHLGDVIQTHYPKFHQRARKTLNMDLIQKPFWEIDIEAIKTVRTVLGRVHGDHISWNVRGRIYEKYLQDSIEEVIKYVKYVAADRSVVIQRRSYLR